MHRQHACLASMMVAGGWRGGGGVTAALVLQMVLQKGVQSAETSAFTESGTCAETSTSHA